MIATTALLFASSLQLVLADVPITVKMFTSADCSGTPTVAGTASDALTDAETLPGTTSHPAGMCIGSTSLGGGVSFMGSCPATGTTTMQFYNTATSTLEQQGMRYCFMANDACTGQCTSSAVFPTVKPWSVPLCKSHTDIFGAPSSYGILSVKISCGDAINPSPPPPLNPPSPGAPAGDPCFPSSSIVTKADGSPSRIDALKEGDEILAATHDGALTTDVVSLLSIAKPEAKAAAYVALASAANKTVTLTAGHHVPVGATCCATLEQAKNVQVGQTMWVVKDGTVMATTVTAKTSVQAAGLHSPVLTNGGFPVVDGIVTSFDSIDKVTLAKHGLAPLLKACKATGTCGSFRKMFLSMDDGRYIA